MIEATKSEFGFPKSNLMVRANFGPMSNGIGHLTSALKNAERLYFVVPSIEEPHDEAQMFSGSTAAWRAAGDGQALSDRAGFRGAVAGMADYVFSAAPLGGAPSVPHQPARGHTGWTVWIAVVRMRKT